MVDQIVLARVIAGAPDDLSAATASLVSVNERIIFATEEDTLYKAIMEEAKALLEARLAVKVAWFDTNFPANAPHSIVYGGYYNTSQGISDWKIQDAASSTVYRYSKETVNVWSVALGFDYSSIVTWRQIVTGLSQDCSWIRVGIHGHNTGITTLVNVSIGERDGVTQNIVDGTQSFFTFSGSNRLNVNPNTTEYSDWLYYAIDRTKAYFVTMFIESGYRTYSGAGSGYSRTGDYSLIEDWGSFGSSLGQTHCLTVVQGWKSGSGTGWDGDSLITQWIADWSAAYPLVWNNPFGTYYMLAALNRGQSLISAKNTLIINRNPILAHYVTP